MWKLIEGALGGVVDKSRRRFIKGVAGAGALAALPKGVKMLMKPAADELSPLPVGPFHESPYFINLKKDLFDESFRNVIETKQFSPHLSFDKDELDAIAKQVSTRTGKSLEELGLSGLSDEKLARSLLRPEILKDVNTPQAIHFLETRVHHMDGSIEAEKVSRFHDYEGYPTEAVSHVDEKMRTRLYSFLENKSIDDWADGKITLDQIDDPNLIQYIKSLEPYKMSRDDVIEYIGDSASMMEEMSNSVAGNLFNTFEDTIRPPNWNKLHLEDRAAEQKAWDDVIQKEKDSDIDIIGNKMKMPSHKKD